MEGAEGALVDVAHHARFIALQDTDHNVARVPSMSSWSSALLS